MGNEETPLTVAELATLLTAADPAVVMLSARQVRRVIKYDRQITGFGLQVPHRKAYFLSRERLLAAADAEDFAGQDLPEQVILIARPDADRLQALPRGDALVKFWRLVFHARVHLALDQTMRAQHWSPAVLRERIHHLGQTEFDEIRRVLRQEKMLLPPRDDRVVYEEFAALYLELRYFAPTLLAAYFPTLAEDSRIEDLLAHDVDARAIFHKTRPAGAPDPGTPPQRDEAGERPVSFALLVPPPSKKTDLLLRAEQAAALGNDVRAALYRAQAGETPALDHLVGRLQAALDFPADQGAVWNHALAPLIPPAAHDVWPAEARLLYDLQKVCVQVERPVYKPNLWGWIISLGRRPLLDPLPHQPVVLAVKHLRRAYSRLATVRLAEADRRQLTHLLQGALYHAEARLRERFRPLVEQALADLDLTPASLPERVALHKLSEELLDRIGERGLLTIGDVRDALSRNQLKLPDLAGPSEFLRGDALLRTNRRLAESGKGIYRFGEFYLRGLQRLSAVAFGTRPGRILTKFAAIPLGGSFVVLEGLQYLINEVLHLAGFHHVHFVTGSLVLGLAFFLLAVINVDVVRRVVTGALHALGRGLHAVLVDLPRRLVALPLVQKILHSRAYSWIMNYFLKPAVLAAPVGGLLAWQEASAPAVFASTISVFLLACLALNSRPGREVQDMGLDFLARYGVWTHDVVLGAIRLIKDLFKSFLEGVDRILYSVDEWLRFRSGDGKLSFWAKLLLSPLWSVLAYLVRFVLLLFIEPQVNPIKHFPVVTVAHKMLLPLIPSLTHLLRETFNLARDQAATLSVIIIGKIPGVFGFLVWELKENWRLYRSNRPSRLESVLIGHHGETMLRFMKPGFHSGTLPKLHAKLRRAQRRAQRTGDARGTRKWREDLHHVEEAIRHFVEREFVFLLCCSRSWSAPGLRVHAIDAGSNRVRIDLACPELGKHPLVLAFEEQSGWLLATVLEPGWLDALGPRQRRALENALAGLYKLAGVDMVREQVKHALAGKPYDLAEEGLVVWPDGNYDSETVYDLRADGPLLKPSLASRAQEAVPRERILYREVGILWGDWVAVWETDQAGAKMPRLVPPWLHLLPR